LQEQKREKHITQWSICRKGWQEQKTRSLACRPLIDSQRRELSRKWIKAKDFSLKHDPYIENAVGAILNSLKSMACPGTSGEEK
jgi:hypothetical protein